MLPKQREELGMLASLTLEISLSWDVPARPLEKTARGLITFHRLQVRSRPGQV